MNLGILVLMSICIFLMLKIIDIPHLYDTFHNVFLLEDLIDHQLEVVLDLPPIHRQEDTQQVYDLV